MTDDAARDISREGLAALEGRAVASGPASRNAETADLRTDVVDQSPRPSFAATPRKRQTTLAVCRNGGQKSAKSGKVRTREPAPQRQQMPGNGRDSEIRVPGPHD